METRTLKQWLFAHPRFTIIAFLLICGVMLAVIVYEYIQDWKEWKAWNDWRNDHDN